MKAFVTFNELEEIVKGKTGKVVKLTRGDGTNTVKVGYNVVKKVPILGNVSKDVTALVTVNGIKGMDLDLSYSFSKGLDLVASGIRAFIGDYIEKTDMLAWGEKDNQVTLHLDKIAKRLNVDSFDKVEKYVAIDSIDVKSDGVAASFSLLLAK